MYMHIIFFLIFNFWDCQHMTVNCIGVLHRIEEILFFRLFYLTRDGIG